MCTEQHEALICPACSEPRSKLPHLDEEGRRICVNCFQKKNYKAVCPVCKGEKVLRYKNQDGEGKVCDNCALKQRQARVFCFTCSKVALQFFPHPQHPDRVVCKKCYDALGFCPECNPDKIGEMKPLTHTHPTKSNVKVCKTCFQELRKFTKGKCEGCQKSRPLLYRHPEHPEKGKCLCTNCHSILDFCPMCDPEKKGPRKLLHSARKGAGIRVCRECKEKIKEQAKNGCGICGNKTVKLNYCHPDNPCLCVCSNCYSKARYKKGFCRICGHERVLRACSEMFPEVKEACICQSCQRKALGKCLSCLDICRLDTMRDWPNPKHRFKSDPRRLLVCPECFQELSAETSAQSAEKDDGNGNKEGDERDFGSEGEEEGLP